MTAAAEGMDALVNAAIRRVQDRLVQLDRGDLIDRINLPPEGLAAPIPIVESDAGLAPWIDHTNLKPDATVGDIDRLCEEALEHRFASVCVSGSRVERCADRMGDEPIPVCAVAGFPLGAMTTHAKAAETRDAIERGAGEIDMVMNVGLMKDDALGEVHDDIRAVVEAAGECPVKVILECCLLTDEEKIAACLLARAAGAAFAKTSTGFSTGGATARDVALLRAAVGPAMGVKAAGGIRDAAAARAMLAAGANRLGASASVAIIGAT